MLAYNVFRHNVLHYIYASVLDVVRRTLASRKKEGRAPVPRRRNLQALADFAETRERFCAAEYNGRVNARFTDVSNALSR